MMYGKFNKDRFCKVLEQIYNERDENVEYSVRLINEDDIEIKKINSEITNDYEKKLKKISGITKMENLTVDERMDMIRSIVKDIKL